MSAADPGARVRSASSILEILQWRAAQDPDGPAYTFLEDGEEASDSLTYASLDARARAVAGHLLEQAGAGERALLLYPPGLEFLVALFGCMYAGVIAVPLHAPKFNRRDSRCVDVSTDAAARVALTTRSVLAGLDRIRHHSPELAGLRWIATDARPLDAAPAPVHAAPEPLAYLQYTSGSTRAPKGVMVSHANLLANIDDIHRAFQHAEDSVLVSWLPHFHDMGLVYGLLAPLALGLRCYVMPPASFLQKPLRWLEAMSRLSGTHSGGPNFAYELCVERATPEQKARLDLRRWAVAFNGAEPVRAETLQRFARAFAGCGFSPRALCPAYGLAEATLKVTSGRRGDGPTESDVQGRPVVGCGVPQPGTELLIVHADTLVPCGPGEIGEIWVNSPSVARGYWNRADESASVFRASPAGGRQDAQFLRTGDLGFILHGELFVTGRIKDLIIIRGRNHYPHDIELTVRNSHPALRVDAGAAVSVDVEGEERLVVVQEIDRHRHAEAESALGLIRAAIVDEHEVAPYAVVLVRQNGVPKTSSGKIQRGACAQAFRDGSLPVVAEWRERMVARADAAAVAAPRTREDLEDFLLQSLARVLSIDASDIDINQPFNSFGLDSLRTLTLVDDIETWFGRELSPTLFWNYPTISELAAHLSGSPSELMAVEGSRG